MSKLANRPIFYPLDVEVEVQNNVLIITKNSKTEKVSLNGIEVENDLIARSCLFSFTKDKKAHVGTVVSLFKAAIKNLIQPHSAVIIVNGVGFKAMILKSNILLMWLGFSHLYAIKIPSEINVSVKDNKISLLGTKAQVTSLASIIKTTKRYDPYKQKGVLIEGNFLLKKEGKKKNK